MLRVPFPSLRPMILIALVGLLCATAAAEGLAAPFASTNNSGAILAQSSVPPPLTPPPVPESAPTPPQAAPAPRAAQAPIPPAAPVPSPPAAPAVNAAAMTCNQLWYARNALYAREGYCFKTQRAIAVFGTRCFPPYGALNAAERNRVMELHDWERRKGC